MRPMATNVTQKDKTLQEVIDWCKTYQFELVEKYGAETQPLMVMMLKSMRTVLSDVITHCDDMLGYGGSMPLEVHNQSEDAK